MRFINTPVDEDPRNIFLRLVIKEKSSELRNQKFFAITLVIPTSFLGFTQIYYYVCQKHPPPPTLLTIVQIFSLECSKMHFSLLHPKRALSVPSICHKDKWTQGLPRFPESICIVTPLYLGKVHCLPKFRKNDSVSGECLEAIQKLTQKDK